LEVLVLIRSLAFSLIVASAFLLVTGQTPEAQKKDPDKAAKTSIAGETGRLRDIPFPAGVDLKFLIKELARELDLNVLFDVESFRGPRRTFIDLRNVTAAAALDYVFLQEELFFEEAGPNTILVATRYKGTSIPQIGVGITWLTEQLAQYFGVAGGILINNVRDASPASKAGLKAGDVIVEIDGVVVGGPLGIVNAVNDKKTGDVMLTIVRDHKRKTISLTLQKGIQSVL
jgi:membrane-associated protease RseP (regulator of RpoE activity)